MPCCLACNKGVDADQGMDRRRGLRSLSANELAGEMGCGCKFPYSKLRQRHDCRRSMVGEIGRSVTAPLGFLFLEEC